MKQNPLALILFLTHKYLQVLYILVEKVLLLFHKKQRKKENKKNYVHTYSLLILYLFLFSLKVTVLLRKERKKNQASR